MLKKMYVIYKKEVEGCQFERNVFNQGDEFLIQKQVLIPVWHGVCTKSYITAKVADLELNFNDFEYVYEELKPTKQVK